jgi:RecA-family ATPase
MLCVSAALGRPLFCIQTTQCRVLFVSLEDNDKVVRNRLGKICKAWSIDEAVLSTKLTIVDGISNPELFTADSRGPGSKTPTYEELTKIAVKMKVELILIDNASDAYGGDEIQRKQVRAFIRSLAALASPLNAALLLLAHVDKNTSRAGKSQDGEGYSGSTAWHNSSRSRIFLSQDTNGNLNIKHEKINFGFLKEPLTLIWPKDGLPELPNGQQTAQNEIAQGRKDDNDAIALLKIIDEFASRSQFCSPMMTARNNVFAVLKSEPIFKKLKLSQEDTRRIVTQCQRAKWMEIETYRTPHRKHAQKWVLTELGKQYAGIFAPSAPSAPTYDVSAPEVESAGGAPCAPTYAGGMGDRAHIM